MASASIPIAKMLFDTKTTNPMYAEKAFATERRMAKVLCPRFVACCLKRESAIPGQRPIRSHSLAQSEAAGQVNERQKFPRANGPTVRVFILHARCKSLSCRGHRTTGPLALHGLARGSCFLGRR